MVDVPFSAEPITIVRIEQPFCANTHGVLPCTATGVPCYNTRRTCRDVPNFIAGETKKIYFGFPGEGRPSDEIFVFPYLRRVQTNPARVNISGADKRANPLGIRATARIQFRDAPHNDRIVDPYYLTRSADPYSNGTFWSKWSERNKFGRDGMIVSILEGYAGDPLSSFVRRVYVFESLDFSGDDSVTMRCRDVMSKVAGENSQAPKPSPGELQNAVGTGATTIKVRNAVAADYPSSGTLRINDELIRYTGTFTGSSGFLNFNVTVRGAGGTQPQSHDVGDQVQECLRFEDLTVDAAIALLYQNYTTVDPAYLPLADWAAEASEHLSAYLIDGLVTEPTDTDELLGEILEQTQSIQWWDERAHEIKFAAIKPIFEQPRLLTEGQRILDGSVKLRDFPDRRVSQVWVYYDPRDHAKDLKKTSNYRRQQRSIDLAMEDPDLFDGPAIRKIYARFIASDAVALETSKRILARYKFGSSEISFTVTDRDRDLDVGDVVLIDYHRIQGVTGEPVRKPWIITSIEVDHRNRQMHCTAEDAALSGTIAKIAENGSGDWAGDGTDPFGVGFISDNAGLLPDGSAGFEIN